MYKTWVEIDSSALRGNFRFFQKWVGPKVTMMVVIKSNAYGHGILETAQILSGDKNTIFGVDSLDEALFLKNNRITNSILILGYIPQLRIAEAIKNNFHISIYSKALLELLQKSNGTFHLKIETGTNRLGINPEALSAIKKFPKIAGVYTHFADVENTQSSFYKTQLKILNQAIAVLDSQGIVPEFIHSASTAGILRNPETHFNLVRLGIGLYTKPRPVLNWKTKIAQIKFVNKEETVGYDRTFRAKQKIKIAVLPVGYGDGYDRKLSNRGEVLIHGRPACVLGRVCMNMMMVDVSKIPGAKVGDTVTLLGISGNKNIFADTIAKKIGTINYEILTRINPLIPRIII